jgi:methionyl aminopeptidase
VSIQLKTKDEIDIMRRANMIVFEVLQALTDLIKPGVSTQDLDALAGEMTKAAGAKAAFLGYPSSKKDIRTFPGVICASVNEAIVHGIPNDKPLKEGDIVSIDYGCVVNDFYGDSAITVGVGQISLQAEKLLEVTSAALEDAIKQCYPGKRIGDISNAVQQRVEDNKFSVVREFVGHGIGRAMHEPPHVPNFGRQGQGRILKEGMVLAIEPMVTAGSHEAMVVEDGWTAVTKDGSLAAHFEHTIAIMGGDPFVLSRP